MFFRTVIVFSLVFLINAPHFAGFSQAQAAQAENHSNSGNYQREIVPLNRVKISVLEEDAKRTSPSRFAPFENLESVFAPGPVDLPPIVSVQDFQGEAYGLRPILTKEDLDRYVRVGDVMISYSHVGQYSDPVTLAKSGMSHGAIVVENLQPDGTYLFPADKDIKLCHVDSPISMSGCRFYGMFHFFRIQSDDSKEGEKAAQRAISLFKKDQIFYDSSYDSEILRFGTAQVAASIQKNESQRLYCSELPYTVHSLELNEPLFAGHYFSELMQKLSSLKENKEFQIDMSKEGVKTSLLQEFQRGVPSTELEKLSGILDVYLSTGQISKAQQTVLDRVKGQTVPPSIFMTRAQEPGRRVFYVGSTETPRQTSYFSNGANPRDNGVPTRPEYQPPRNDAVWNQHIRKNEYQDDVRRLVLSMDNNRLLVVAKNSLQILDAGTGEITREYKTGELSRLEPEVGQVIQTHELDGAQFLDETHIVVSRATSDNWTIATEYGVRYEKRAVRDELVVWNTELTGEQAFQVVHAVDFSQENQDNAFRGLGEISEWASVYQPASYTFGNQTLTEYGTCVSATEAAYAYRIVNGEQQSRVSIKPLETVCLRMDHNTVVKKNFPKKAFLEISPNGRFALAAYRNNDFSVDEIGSRIESMSDLTTVFDLGLVPMSGDKSIGFLGRLFEYFYIDSSSSSVMKVNLNSPSPDQTVIASVAPPLAERLKEKDATSAYFRNLQFVALNVAPAEHTSRSKVEIYKLTTGEKLATLYSGAATVESILISNDGRTIYTRDADGFLRAFDWQRTAANFPETASQPNN